ncbi:MAG TPA: nucleotidyltransferase domain-containing protein [Nitrospirae bacterium]|nr:nucleotidyltransferase domain-containing protein [Nitrospirota bacterium]HDK16740.1 nucleotidyltransferase domain-containing protein [Nitrospirota bacterium]
MSRKLNKAVSDYMRLLRKHYSSKILTAVLFGSVARGKFNKESDADILIIVSDSDKKMKDEISMSAYEIMLKNDVVLSPVVMDKNTFDWYRRNKDPFYKNVRKDGIEIWTKTQKSSLKSA